MASMIFWGLAIFGFWWIYIHLIAILYPKEYPFFKYLAILGISLFIGGALLELKWISYIGFFCFFLSFIPCWFWVNCTDREKQREKLYDYFNKEK